MIRFIKKISLFVLVLLLALVTIGCGETIVEVKTISLNGPNSIEVGAVGKITATVQGLEGEVQWSTSDPTIATVENGTVTALKAGDVIITATAEDVSSTISIKVNEKVKERESLFCGINIINDEMVAHEKVELSLVERTDGYVKNNFNPFDYNQIKVYGVFTSPSRETNLVAIAFWYRDYAIVLDTNITTGHVREGEINGLELVNFTSGPEYRMRFMPSEAGTWTYHVYIEMNGEELYEDLNGEIEIQDSSKEYKGLIKVNKSNNRTFMYEDGTTFMPIGENMGWWDKDNTSRKTYDYKYWFENANKNNMNIARIWMAPWSFCLHWGKSATDLTDRLAYAARLDRVLEYADQYDMYIMLTLLNHGQFSTGADPTWKDNPYNAANGGVLDKPQKFFTSAEAKEIYKNELLYIIGRYGYSDKIMCWELFNEVDWTDNADINAVNIKAWHKEMAEFIKNNDCYGHMITTSYKTEQGASFTLDVIDFACPHSYGYAGKNINDTLPQMLDKLYNQYNKPILHAEIGIDWQNGQNNYRLDPTGVNLRQNSWAGMMGGGAGGAMNWWWDSYVHPYNLYYQFKGAGAYAKLLDLNGMYEQLRTLSGLKKDNKVGVIGYKFDNRIYGYVYDKDWSYFNETGELSNINLEIPFGNGSYTVTFYNALTGVEVKNVNVEVTDGVIRINLPAFTNDVAFIIN